MSIGGKVNISGTWKNLTSGKINVGGVWKNISKGYVLVNGIWKPIPFGGGWDYEGTMTVGSWFGINGWFPLYNIGSITPSPVYVGGLSISYIIWNGSLYIGNSPNSITIEINGTEYVVIDGNLSTANPFPAGGQSCTIKIKVN